MRCKRCGSKITFDNEICPGCGKSMIELNGHNEIEYDDNAVLNIETIKKVEVAPKVEEEVKPLDIFGDAMEEAPVIKPVEEPIVEPKIEENTSFESLTNEPTNSVPLEEIKFAPLEEVKPVEVVAEDVNVPPTEKPVNRLESIVNNNDEEFFIKKSKKGLIFGIIALIILVLGGVFAYFYIKTAPKKIFSMVINSASNLINTNISEPTTITNGFYFNIGFEDMKEDNKIYDILNNLYVIFDSKVDKQNKNTLFNLTAKYKEDTLISGDAYVVKENAYVLLKDIYDKFIKVPLDPNMLNDLYEANYVNALTVLKELLKEVDNSLDKKYFTRSIDKLNVISTLTFNSETFKEFMTTLTTNIKNNKTIISNLSKISGQSEDDIKALFNNADYNFDGELKIIITANVLDNKITKVEISGNENNASDKLVIDVLDNNVYNFEISGEANTKGSLAINNKNDYTEYKFTINDEEYGKVNYNFGYKVKYNELLTIPSLDDSVMYSELTDEDKEDITTKLFEKESIKNLYTEINSLFTDEVSE